MVERADGPDTVPSTSLASRSDVRRLASRLVPGDPEAVLRERWLAVLVVVGSLVQASALARVLPGEQPPAMKDSIIFELYGWNLLAGRRMYTEMWELKPPLNYQTTAVLALLSGGDPLVYHYLNVLATAAAAVGCAVVVGLLVVEVTEDRLAGLVGGLAVFAHSVVFMRAAYGFKSKYFVALAGLLSVYLLLRDRQVLGGVAAAAAAGYWQLGIVFPLVGLGLAYQRGGQDGVKRLAAGGLAMTALTLAPVVLRGGLVAMLAQVIVAPMVVGSEMALARRFKWFLTLLGEAVPAVALGLVGFASVAVGPDRREHWWAPVVWAWFAGHLVFLNVDYFGDLIVFVVVSAVGVGVLLGRLPRRPAVSLQALVALFVLVNAVTLGGYLGMDSHPVQSESPAVAPAEKVNAPYIGKEWRSMLFNDVEPTTCHVFVSSRHRAWLNLTGADNRADICGHLPPGYEWVRTAVPAPLRGPTPGSETAGPGSEAGTPTPMPTSSPIVETRTPTPRPDAIVLSGLDWHRENGTLVVSVPVRNRYDTTNTSRVEVVVSVEGETRSAVRTVTLDGGERRELTFRFDVPQGRPDVGVTAEEVED